jgi:hypothetical protein
VILFIHLNSELIGQQAKAEPGLVGKVMEHVVDWYRGD